MNEMQIEEIKKQTIIEYIVYLLTYADYKQMRELEIFIEGYLT